MELFFLVVTACLNGCQDTPGSMKPFQTLEACVTAAHDDQESKKRFARMRNVPVYLYECRSASRVVKVPEKK